MRRRHELRPIGHVRSPLRHREEAPRQGYEGAPAAWLTIDQAVGAGLRDLRPGDTIIVLTWLDRASREVLSTRPQDDPAMPERGVFSTRSPDRPNPIGLHRVEVVSVEGTSVRVRDLEALDGTPILDIKPTLDGSLER